MKFAALAAALLVSVASPALAQGAYEGTWDCDGATITLEGGTYKSGAAPAKPIADVMNSGRDWAFTLTDGYAFSMMGVTETAAVWTSLESGDTLECRRTGRAAQPASTAAQAAPGASLPAAALTPWTTFSGTGATMAYAGSLPTLGYLVGVQKPDNPDRLCQIVFQWPGNQPGGTVQVSFDGGPFTAYPADNGGGVDKGTSAWSALLPAMRAGNFVTFLGADGRPATLTLQGSSRQLDLCD